jgi:autotransporter-associated beta strand protein
MKISRPARLCGWVCLIHLVTFLEPAGVRAGSATWNLNATSSDWNTAANWTPATVPNGPSDTASFATSNTTGVSLSANTEVSAIIFNTGASAFTTTASPGFTLTISGTGISNNAGIMESFVTAAKAGSHGVISFTRSATAGNLTGFTNNGGPAGGALGGETDFFDTSTAGNGIFINNPGQVSGALSGLTQFFGSASAGNGTFTDNGATKFSADGGETLFFDVSNAGNGTFINNPGNTGNFYVPKGGTLTTVGGHIEFHGSSSASNGTFTNIGAMVNNFAAVGGSTFFFDTSTAGDATFTNTPATAVNAVSGQMGFFGSSTGGNATIISNGAATAGVEAPFMQFFDNSTAGDAILINNGGEANGALGAGTIFIDRSSLGNATLIANGGLNGGEGGYFRPLSRITGAKPRVEVFGNGNFDISESLTEQTSVGSIEGDGIIFLGGRNLGVGSTNLSTNFSGVIQDGGFGGTGGSLTKVGTGTLTLTGANRYTGGTTITGGILFVSNSSDSGTGTGAVSVNAGTLGGSGIITGAVTVGTGSGAGASLNPAQGVHHPVTLTIQSSLTFKADSTYNYKLSSRRAKADQVIANGVTIESGAQFNLHAVAHAHLHIGQVFTAISNTSANPIGGTFSNLADGAIVTVNGNNFQASYTGGDGNDLTLTVVP